MTAIATTRIEELAQSILELTPEDMEAFSAAADVETAAFGEYLSEYTTTAAALRVCKGCHGG